MHAVRGFGANITVVFCCARMDCLRLAEVFVNPLPHGCIGSLPAGMFDKMCAKDHRNIVLACRVLAQPKPLNAPCTDAE